MTWALKRQIFYIFVLILFFSGVGFLIAYPHLTKAPTCTDNIQNGTEVGIDCGGSCLRACVSQTDEMSVLWTRAFKIVPGRYNAVAYILNHNKNIAAQSVHYRFRFADKNNVYIGKREGVTSVPPSGNFAVFEPAIDVGSSIPVYVTFEFTDVPDWTFVSQNTINQAKVLVSNIKLTDTTTNPRLSATIKNTSLFTIPDVNVVAILYDASHNSVSSSRTYFEVLNPEEARDVTFTWPEPFDKDVVEEEIIPMYNIFTLKLK